MDLYFFCRINITALFLTILTMLTGFAAAQQPDDEEASRRIWARHEAFRAKSVSQLLEDLDRYPDDLMIVQRLRMLDDKAAIDPLKRAFLGVDDVSKKQVIAAALLSLGARGESYFEFLAKAAMPVVRSGTPFPLLVDKGGEVHAREFAPSFIAWCEEQGLDPHQMALEASSGTMTKLLPLILARDPRATEIFLQALRAPNLYLVAMGISGLAILGDERTIDPVIDAIRRFPPSMRQRQAAALMLFDDPKAKKMARQWVPDEAVLLAFAQSHQRMVPSSGNRTKE